MDQRLRSLERQVAAGDAGAEARLLVERVRRGELDPERLELLAYLGDSAALEALEGQAPRRPEGLESWVRGLKPWGRVVWVRAAVAAARLVLPFFEARQVDDTRARDAIQATEAWLKEDTDEAIEEAYATALAAQSVLISAFRSGEDMMQNVVVASEVFRESRAAVQAALTVVEDEDRALTHAVLAAVAARERIALGEAPGSPGNPSGLHVRAAQADRLGQLPELATESSTRAVREAMSQALLSWLHTAGDGTPAEEAE